MGGGESGALLLATVGEGGSTVEVEQDESRAALA
ncbi:hypothetical protein SVIRM249S_06034 [Streptomyces viridochromogenes]